MSERIECPRHGSAPVSFVCRHVALDAGQGWHCDSEPGNPRPMAWCGACDAELERAGDSADAWLEHSDMRAICSHCYDEAKRRNCHWQFEFLCPSCDKTHTGVPGWAFALPDYVLEIPEAERGARCRIDTETCSVDGEHYFVRAALEIPVVDAPEPLIYGVWQSVSEKHYRQYRADWSREGLRDWAPMAGWIANRITIYPDTTELISRMIYRGGSVRPYLELKPVDHPLVVEQAQGITRDRVVEIFTALQGPH